MIDRKHFFDSVRESLFNDKLSESQVEGLNAIIDEYEHRELTDKRLLAYILATAIHETAKTMQPIEEYGRGATRRYGKKVRVNGEAYYNNNHIYYGRGYVQTTWIDNYEKLTRAATRNGFDWDFVNKPELLLEVKPSIWAAYYGMISGMYTGRKLYDYFNDEKDDSINARKIINGLDKAELIAGYHRKFLTAIKDA